MTELEDELKTLVEIKIGLRVNVVIEIGMEWGLGWRAERRQNWIYGLD